ncbi:ABC transporter permease, partial [Streptomyces sp. SID12488]|nr:ABC transporter permease [Streptomyces sp. SID12488]
MSTITSTRTPVPSPVQGGRPVYGVTARRVLRSEWAKLWSLRSTWITLGLGLLFLVAFGLIASWQFKSRITSGRHMDGDFASSTAVSLSLFGTNFAQLALGVLGVMVT